MLLLELTRCKSQPHCLMVGLELMTLQAGSGASERIRCTQVSIRDSGRAGEMGKRPLFSTQMALWWYCLC